MRFLYYDRIKHIEKGKAITAVKAFSLSEEFLRGHYKKVALVPGVIFIEAMAQALGWLINYSHDFRLTCIMSIIEDVSTTPDMRPGFEAEIHGEIISTTRRDSLGRAWVEVQGRKVAEVNRIIYSHFHKIDSRHLKNLFYYYSGLNPDDPSMPDITDA
jgi:3-hydroxyacyl-[acyl-carrier-protein] dehydratase